MLMFPEMFRGRNVLLFTASLTVLRCLMHGYMRTLELAHLPGCARARPAPQTRARSTRAFMPTMTSRRSLAAIVLCALCTCANLVPHIEQVMLPRRHAPDNRHGRHD